MKLVPVSLLVLLGAFGCMSCPFGAKDEEAAAPAAQVDHGSDFVTWGMNPTTRQTSSAWINATTGVVSTHTGITLPGAGKLWDWTLTPLEVSTLDCACYDPFNLPVSEAARSERRARCTRPARLDTLSLVPRDGGTALVLLAEAPADAAIPTVHEGTITRTYTPLGAVGPWFFVARRQETLACGAATPVVTWTWQTVDMRVPSETALLSPADLSNIEGDEKTRVAEALCVAPDCFSADPAKVRFALLRPGFGVDGKLLARLQFYSEAAIGAADGLWDSGTRSVLVDAAALPAGLAPWQDTPPAVMAHWRSEPPVQGGWMPADSILQAAFAGP